MRSMQSQHHIQAEKREATRQHLDLACLIASFRQQRCLSQEQLARASGLSRTYIYHLERAQRTHPSPQVVQKIARALELPALERQQLYHAYGELTGQSIEENHVEQRIPDLRELIGEFVSGTSYPTHTLDRFWFMPTWNQAALALFEMPAPVSAVASPHLLEWLFTPHVRQRTVSWEQVACRLVNDFRYHTRTLAYLPRYKTLWKHFQTFPDFSRIARISSAGEQPAPSLQVQLYHRRFGLLTFRTVTIQVKGSHHDWLISYLPDDQQTRQQCHLYFG